MCRHEYDSLIITFQNWNEEDGRKRAFWKLILGEDISIIAWFAIIDNQGPKSHLLRFKPVTYFLFFLCSNIDEISATNARRKHRKNMIMFMHECLRCKTENFALETLAVNVPKTVSESLFVYFVHSPFQNEHKHLEKRERVLFLLACGTNSRVCALRLRPTMHIATQSPWAYW